MEWQRTTLMLSTKTGPAPISALVCQSLAVHVMLADDVPEPCEANGWCVSWAPLGLRMSYGMRTWESEAAAVQFAEALLGTGLDWSRWFSEWGRRDYQVPRELANRFGSEQARLGHMLKPGILVRPAAGGETL